MMDWQKREREAVVVYPVNNPLLIMVKFSADQFHSWMFSKWIIHKVISLSLFYSARSVKKGFKPSKMRFTCNGIKMAGKFKFVYSSSHP